MHRIVVPEVDPGAHLSGSPPEAMRLEPFGRFRSQGGSQQFRRQLAKGPAIALPTPFELAEDRGVQIDRGTCHSIRTGTVGEAIFSSKVAIASAPACCAAATTIASEIRRAETPWVQ